jgi:hypothetical protein
MATLFDSPRTLACLQLVVAARRDDILAWLRPIEQLIRRLLLLEAQSLPPSASSQSATTRAPKPAPKPASEPRQRRLIVLDPEAPHTWPAHFRLLDRRRPSRHAGGPMRTGLHAGLYNSFALAERWQAALRVAENPARYVRRAAALLKRAPLILESLCKPPPRHAHLHGPCDWAIDEACLRLAFAPPDSS